MQVKALYTLSGGGVIYISKNQIYDLHEAGKGRPYILDNQGNQMPLNRQTLHERFEVIQA